jgi:uncharacterized DUF497 family protein
MNFEWDEKKNRENIKKHGVSFITAMRVFEDENRVILRDDKHSADEERFFCVGNDGKETITVRFTMRSGVVRIFGAGYWRKGKKGYEKEKSRLH